MIAHQPSAIRRDRYHRTGLAGDPEVPACSVPPGVLPAGMLAGYVDQQSPAGGPATGEAIHCLRNRQCIARWLEPPGVERQRHQHSVAREKHLSHPAPGYRFYELRVGKIRQDLPRLRAGNRIQPNARTGRPGNPIAPDQVVLAIGQEEWIGLGEARQVRDVRRRPAGSRDSLHG
jgi:hypothetical protein